MEKFIIVRHGNYSAQTGHLTNHGKMKVNQSLLRIANFLESIQKKAIILSSDSPRSQQTAEIIAEGLGINFEVDKIFFSSKAQGCRLEKATETILQRAQAKKADVVILVTHLQYCEYLPCHIHEHLTGKQAYEDVSLEEGYFSIIDFSH